MPALLYPAAKRVVDVVISAGLLALMFPALLYAALRIKLTDGGPILYRGIRVGRNGVPFEILKLRTMVVDAEKLGGDSTPVDDPRVTRVGHVLRRWKLDEIPQFWNVLRGEMSLVGPRPQVVSDVERYTAEERHLLDVRPGITDWASIHFRDEGDMLAGYPDPDEAYDRLIRPQKIELGLRYVRQASLSTDLRILLQTARSIVSGR
jgi:lipopolysaccharide/colanic/teichoic acid biosynthesis glycosyltransferase